MGRVEEVLGGVMVWGVWIGRGCVVVRRFWFEWE